MKLLIHLKKLQNEILNYFIKIKFIKNPFLILKFRTIEDLVEYVNGIGTANITYVDRR